MPTEVVKQDPTFLTEMLDRRNRWPAAIGALAGGGFGGYASLKIDAPYQAWLDRLNALKEDNRDLMQIGTNEIRYHQQKIATLEAQQPFSVWHFTDETIAEPLSIVVPAAVAAFAVAAVTVKLRQHFGQR